MIWGKKCSSLIFFQCFVANPIMLVVFSSVEFWQRSGKGSNNVVFRSLIFPSLEISTMEQVNRLLCLCCYLMIQSLLHHQSLRQLLATLVFLNNALIVSLPFHFKIIHISYKAFLNICHKYVQVYSVSSRQWRFVAMLPAKNDSC